MAEGHDLDLGQADIITRDHLILRDPWPRRIGQIDNILRRCHDHIVKGDPSPGIFRNIHRLGVDESIGIDLHDDLGIAGRIKRARVGAMDVIRAQDDVAFGRDDIFQIDEISRPCGIAQQQDGTLCLPCCYSCRIRIQRRIGQQTVQQGHPFQHIRGDTDILADGIGDARHHVVSVNLITIIGACIVQRIIRIQHQYLLVARPCPHIAIHDDPVVTGIRGAAGFDIETDRLSVKGFADGAAQFGQSLAVQILAAAISFQCALTLFGEQIHIAHGQNPRPLLHVDTGQGVCHHIRRRVRRDRNRRLVEKPCFGLQRYILCAQRIITRGDPHIPQAFQCGAIAQDDGVVRVVIDLGSTRRSPRQTIGVCIHLGPDIGIAAGIDPHLIHGEQLCIANRDGGSVAGNVDLTLTARRSDGTTRIQIDPVHKRHGRAGADVELLTVIRQTRLHDHRTIGDDHIRCRIDRDLAADRGPVKNTARTRGDVEPVLGARQAVARGNLNRIGGDHQTTAQSGGHRAGDIRIRQCTRHAQGGGTDCIDLAGHRRDLPCGDRHGFHAINHHRTVRPDIRSGTRREGHQRLRGGTGHKTTRSCRGIDRDIGRVGRVDGQGLTAENRVVHNKIDRRQAFRIRQRIALVLACLRNRFADGENAALGACRIGLKPDTRSAGGDRRCIARRIDPGVISRNRIVPPSRGNSTITGQKAARCRLRKGHRVGEISHPELRFQCDIGSRNRRLHHSIKIGAHLGRCH